MKERIDDRSPVKIVGSYRVGRGTKRSVTMLDISETGARFHDHRTILKPESRITMRVDTLGPFDAVVRWVDSDAIGVEFAQRIYGPVFEHIRDTLSGQIASRASSAGPPSARAYRPRAGRRND